MPIGCLILAGEKLGKVVSFEAEVNKRKKRRRVGSLAWLGWVCLMLIALTLGYGFAQSSIFNVRSIVVNGTSRLAEEDIIKLSGFTVGEHIYEANINKAQTMIKTNFWVEQVSIERQLPSTLVINIKERVPVAAIIMPEGLYIVDFSGTLLIKQKLLDGMTVIPIAGVSNIDSDIKPGTPLENDSVTVALAVIRQMDERSSSLISELDVSNPQNIVPHLSYGVNCYLGDKSNFAEKFAVALDILQSERQKGLLESVNYIDVSLPEQPVLAYLNPEPAEMEPEF